MDFLKSFLGSLAAVIVAGGILMIIFFAILFGSIEGIFSEMGKEKKKDLEEKTVLHVQLNKPIYDRASDNPFENFNFADMENSGELGLKAIIDNLEAAKDDENIEGIYLDITGVPAGMATTSEIRDALVDFKESGKWVIAYSENYTQKGYYIASVADEVYLYPEGGLDWKGLGAELMFFKGAMEKLEIEPTIVRGPGNIYKSAVEPYYRDKMSDPNREQMQALLDDLWADMLNDISESRDISVDKLNEMASTLEVSMFSAGENALANNFVDGLKYKDEILDILRGKLGIDEDEEIESISLARYIKNNKPQPDWQMQFGDKDGSLDDDKETDGDKDKVAVVYATGAIMGGNGDDRTIGSERISRAIRDARRDSLVKAIVLRVNSPGGSALASDVILREVNKAKEAGIKVVVSMGDVAASGGYYISCSADKIVASPSTVTGSIGVFGMLPNMQGLFNNKLGITTDRVYTNEHANLISPFKEMDEYELDRIQESVEEVYTDFLQLVAEGRGMDTAAVHKVARGRVWSGTDALEIGLIDELGGMEEALDIAIELAGLTEGEYEIEELPKRKDPFEEFLKELSGETKAEVGTAVAEKMLSEEFGETYQQLKALREMASLEGVQMRLPYVLKID